MQDFRKLKVWSKAHAHTLNVRKATNRFPHRGFAALKNQMLRSSESVATNIVEGCGASSNREFARFLEISLKSAGEIEYQLQLARDYSVMAAKEWESLTADTIEIRKCCTG